MRKLFSLLFTLALLITSCSEAGTSISVPRILNTTVSDVNGFQIYSASIGETIYLLIQAEDKGRDMVLLNYYATSGSTIIAEQVSIINSPADVDIYILPVILTGPAGSWDIQLSIEDLQGNESETVRFTFTLLN